MNKKTLVSTIALAIGLLGSVAASAPAHAAAPSAPADKSFRICVRWITLPYSHFHRICVRWRTINIPDYVVKVPFPLPDPGPLQVIRPELGQPVVNVDVYGVPRR